VVANCAPILTPFDPAGTINANWRVEIAQYTAQSIREQAEKPQVGPIMHSWAVHAALKPML